eukprot:TRINITY_DN7678_c0_g1_i1.p1 TRINITY_DN7678_c0_g1~~TRINITY_DN7678_c0_g1_i1.p1  ORF type:complete len:254 (+),score=13.54 TRINITY_DN7678_c0_g1_i1:143-904(+)
MGFYAGTRMTPSQKTYNSLQLSPEVMQKLYYRTQVSDLPFHKPTQEQRGENFIDIHGVGQRASKYLEYQERTAPLLNRLACTYTQGYTALPLGDNVVNKALARSFKEGTGSNQSTQNPIPLDSRTSYDDTFKELTSSDLKKAVQKNQQPPFEKTFTVCPPGELLEQKSHAHRLFGKPYDGLKSIPAVPPMPGLYIGGAAKNVPIKSSQGVAHTRDAVRVPRSSSTPTLGLTPLPPQDPNICRMKRTVYSMPGI